MFDSKKIGCYYYIIDQVDHILNTLMGDILGRDFYCRDTALVAKELLGKILVRSKQSENLGGIILETEAYYGIDDPASHAYGGITPRNRVMFEKSGIAYVYLCYGMYYLLNVVTEEEGIPGAVLIRAISPVWGIKIMEKRRKIKTTTDLSDGPGKLTIAFGINKDDNYKDIVFEKSGINIIDSHIQKDKYRIINTRRIGLKKGSEKKLRYMLEKKRDP